VATWREVSAVLSVKTMSSRVVPSPPEQLRISWLLERLPLAMVWTDGVQAHLNSACARLLGIAHTNPSRHDLPLEEMLGLLAFHDSDGLRLEFEHCPLQRALRGDHFESQRLDLTLHDGEVVELCVQAYPASAVEPGQPGAILVLEEYGWSVNSESGFGEWTGALGHELRGALQSIALAAHAAGRTIPVELSGPRQHLELLLRNADNLGRLVQDFVDAAKLGARAVDWTAEDVPLLETVSKAAESFPFPDASHQTQISIDPELRVRADPARLSQILHNLFSNAKKYSSPGKILIGAIAEPTRVVLWISDSGPGIREADQKLLFRLFSRLPSKQDGSGIGLWICRKLARLMGGDMWLTSREGGETTVSLALPRVLGQRTHS
jgi:signal transduction histidine kinase